MTYKLIRNSQAEFRLVAKDINGNVMTSFSTPKENILVTTTELVSLQVLDVAWTNGVAQMHVQVPNLAVSQTTLTLQIDGNPSTTFVPYPFPVEISHAYVGRFISDGAVLVWDLEVPVITLISLSDFSGNSRFATKPDGITPIMANFLWLETDAFVTEAGGYPYIIGTTPYSWQAGTITPWVGLIDANGRVAVCETATPTYPVKTLQMTVVGWDFSANYSVLVGGFGVKITSPATQDGLGFLLTQSAIKLVKADGTEVLSVARGSLFGTERQIVVLALTFDGTNAEFYVNQTKVGTVPVTLGNHTGVYPTIFAGGGLNPDGWVASTTDGIIKFAVLDFAVYSTVQTEEFIVGNAAAWGV